MTRQKPASTSATAAKLPPSQFVDLGGPVHYREWTGPEDTTFVCLHGLGETHLTWMTVAPSLARIGHVLAFDFPGFGLTPRAGRTASLAGCQSVLSGFIRARASGSVVLIGSSMGGGVAAVHAAREPGSISALVLSSSYLPPHFGGFWAPAVAAGMLVKRIRAVIGSLRVSRPWEGDTHWVTESSLRMALADPASVSEDVVAAELDLHEHRPDDRDANRTAAEAIASLMCFSVSITARRRYGDITCPTLVIHAKDDALIPLPWAEVIVRGRPNWRLVPLDGDGHPVHLTETERWFTAVCDWVTSL